MFDPDGDSYTAQQLRKIQEGESGYSNRDLLNTVSTLAEVIYQIVTDLKKLREEVEELQSQMCTHQHPHGY